MRPVLLFLDVTNTGIQLLMLMLGLGIVFQSRVRRFLQTWQQFRQWQTTHGAPGASGVTESASPTHGMHAGREESGPVQLQAPVSVDFSTIPLATVPNAARALAEPPASLWYAIEYIRRYGTHGRYTFPLGWYLDSQNEPDLFVGHLVNDVNCGLITAIQGGGKDTLLLNMLLTLTTLNTPERLQIVIVDGKGGLDYIGWQEKSHVWHIAQEEHELPEVMDLLTAERMRRIRTLRQAKVSKWENYKGSDMPMIVVVFSEIKMLQRIMDRKEIETYLDSELSVWRGLGMRMFVCTQNSSNWSKEWRAAFEFFAAGTQPSRDEDKPNTGKDTSLLESIGVIPPSKLPSVSQAPGVMSIVHGNTGKTVRTSFIDDVQRAYWLDRLPNVTSEQAQARDRQKAALLRDLALFRATVDGEPTRKGKSTKSQAQLEPDVTHDWRNWDLEPDALSEQPVIALAKTTDPAPEYDAPVLANVLATTKLKDLPQHPVFVAACKVAYQKRQTYMGVAREFWGTTTGSREMAIKEALGHKEPVRAELASAA